MQTVVMERRAATPPRIDPDNYRIYLVVKYCGYLAIPVHVVYLPLCFALGLPLFGYYNVFSMLAWPLALMLNHNGRHQPAIDLITIEIVGFTTIGVYFLGWESGFQTLLMPLIAFVMLNYRLRMRRTVVEALALVALYVGLYRFSVGRELTVTSPAVIEFVLYLNIGIVFAALCIVSYYFRKASISAERRMKALATTDPLTGLANRIKLWDALEQARLGAEHDQAPFVVALADVDHFKTINDTHGHDVGDAALRQVAQLLSTTLREKDLVGRWGGEEFLCLLPDTSLETGLAVCERMRAAIETARVRSSDLEIAVTITIGVAGLEPGERVEVCIKRADSALYRGKHTGRNRIVAAEGALVDPHVLGERSTA